MRTDERPAYAGEQTHPRVLIDEAHHNFLTAGDRYKPLADLLTSDGYKVAPNTKPFTRDMLAGCEVLVVANAMGGTAKAEAARPAFTREECAAVVQWIKEGGALLLISDQPPWGPASAELAQSLGVNTSQGVTFDPADRSDSAEGRLNFTRENKLLGEHPITQGRDESEKINRVKTFIGQSLKGPEGSTPLLKLADTARSDRRARGLGLGTLPGRCFHFRQGASGRPGRRRTAFGAGHRPLFVPHGDERAGLRQPAVGAQHHALALGPDRALNADFGGESTTEKPGPGHFAVFAMTKSTSSWHSKKEGDTLCPSPGMTFTVIDPPPAS